MELSLVLLDIILMNLNLQLDRWRMLTENQDGGDSANRTAVYLTVRAWEQGTSGYKDWYSQFTNCIMHPWIPGLLRRHPDTSMWYGDWQRMSRDQTFPVLISAKEYNDYKFVFKYIIGHFLRFFLFTSNIRNNGATAD